MHVQFVRRMGVRTHKSKVMCRPASIQIATEPPPYLCGNPDSSEPYSPATVEDRKDIGIVMKYWIRFDDGLVAPATQKSIDASPAILPDAGARQAVAVVP